MDKQTLTHSCWNINDVGSTGRPQPPHTTEPFTEFTFQARLPSILEEIKAADSDYLGLVEVSRTSLPVLEAELTKLGYNNFNYMSYAPGQAKKNEQGEEIPSTDQSLYMLSCVKNVNYLDTVRFWFTSTPLEPITERPDELMKSVNEMYERGALINIYEANGKTYIYALVHSSLRLPYQLKCHEMLYAYMQELAEEYPGAILLVGGDMNTFDNYQSRLNMFLSNGYERPLLEEGSEDIHATFRAYPADLGIAFTPEHKAIIDKCHEECKGLLGDNQAIRARFIAAAYALRGGPLECLLDHVLVKGAKGVRVPSKPFGDFDPQVEGKPCSASDHSMVTVRV